MKIELFTQLRWNTYKVYTDGERFVDRSRSEKWQLYVQVKSCGGTDVTQVSLRKEQ